MSFSKKIIVVMLLVSMCVGIIHIGQNNNIQEEEAQKASYYQTETLYLWYTDESFTDFFTNAAVAFHDENPDVRVIPQLVSAAEYLENINDASLNDGEFPDLYMITNDSLEKAYLAGLASRVRDKENVLNSAHFFDGALNAVTYRNLYVAYPISFDTTVLLYNKTFLRDWVDKVNAGDVDSDGEFLYEGEAEAPSAGKTLDDYIPDSFDDIISFADEYEAADGVESILEWDVSDILFNYLFVGKYMVVGGDAGDDTDNIDIYNENTTACVQVYQNLHDVFSIDAATTDYDSVINDFLDGKTVFTIVTSDAIAKVNEKIAESETQSDAQSEIQGEAEGEALEETQKQYEYGYALVPNVTEELESRSMSVTNSLVINGYSVKKEAANSFAAFVSTKYSDQLYARTGKLSAAKDAGYIEDSFVIFQKEYSDSIPLPKIVEASNLWVQLEIAFTEIWSGEDADERLKTFADQIASQLVTE